VLVFVNSVYPTYQLTVIGLSGKGVQLWEQTFLSAYSYSADFAGLGVPFTRQLYDGVRGKATDILIGANSYADALAALRVTLIDGSDGAITDGSGGVGVGAFPTVAATNDLSGDGLDDYAVATADPVRQGVITARSSDDGAIIWEQGGLDLHRPYLSLYPIGDVSGDGASELVTRVPPKQGRGRFLLMGGAMGSPLWEGVGDLVYALNRSPGQRLPSLTGSSTLTETATSFREEYRAYDQDGDLRYVRRYSPEGVRCDGSCSGVILFVPGGDLDSD
jgi:hypothetical protein